MVSTHEKKQSNRSLLNQVDDFGQDLFIGNTVRNRLDNATVKECTGDRVFTVDNPGSKLAANEIMVNVGTVKRCFNERFDWEMGKIVHTVEYKIQNAILTATDSFVAPRIKKTIRSINASPGRSKTSIPAKTERGERIRITGSFENVSERSTTLQVLNTDDETQNNIPDEVSNFSVPHTHFDQQPHTHHKGGLCHTNAPSRYGEFDANSSEDRNGIVYIGNLSTIKKWSKST